MATASSIRRTWKEAERRVADFFGGRRTPLSGRNSQHETASDVIKGPPGIFIEVKQRKRWEVWSIWRDAKELAKEEGKVPVLVLDQKRSPGFLLVIHSDDLQEFVNCMFRDGKISVPCA